MKFWRTARRLLWFGNVLGVWVLGALLKRAYTTDAGHGGVIELGLFPFLLLGATGLLLFKAGFVARLAILLGTLGVAAIPYLGRVNVLRSYSDWIGAGLPAPPDTAFQHFVAASYAGACLLLVLALWLDELRRQRARKRTANDPAVAQL